MRTAEEWATHFGLRPGFAELFRIVQHDAVKDCYETLEIRGHDYATSILAGSLLELERPEPNISKLALEGFWQCKDCHGIDTRQDGEQGQPDHCNRCGSIRLKYHPPILTTTDHDKKSSDSI